MDDGIGDIVRALQRASMWDNTLLVFSSDNGGPTDGTDDNMNNNFPLRGCKGGYFEGGLRVPAFLTGGTCVTHALPCMRKRGRKDVSILRFCPLRSFICESSSRLVRRGPSFGATSYPLHLLLCYMFTLDRLVLSPLVGTLALRKAPAAPKSTRATTTPSTGCPRSSPPPSEAPRCERTPRS